MACTKFLLLILLFPISSCAGEDAFPKDDYKTFFKDLNEALGLEQLLDSIGFYFQTYIRIGQAYTWKKFDQDWKDLKTNLSFFKVFHFVHKMFWVCTAQTCVRLISSAHNGQIFLLRFLKSKCDKHLGKDAVLHPWNIMMDKNEQHVSFLVFVYGLFLSLILIKILSLWNFMVYLAFGFLLYSAGGPYMLFKGLLTVTGLAWFIFDLVINYPFQTAIVILSLYLLSSLNWIVSKFLQLVFGRTPNEALPARRQAFYDNIDFHNGAPNRSPPHQKGTEFNALTKRINGMERRTDLLNEKIEQLAQSMESVLQNMDDDDE